MNRTHIRSLIARSIAVAGIATLAIGGGAQATSGGGLSNCVDVTGKAINRVGCYENVWSNGTQYRMTFSNTQFSGTTPGDLDPFYVIAPQTAQPQGPMPTFPHDHTVNAIPKGNGGTYSTKLQGFFVLCSGQGLISGACVPLWIAPAGDPLPFAQRVDGHGLTTTNEIESAAAAGDVVLVNLGPNAVIVGSVSATH
jgi:hypothetical protein